jgi:hypothetical protein
MSRTNAVNLGTEPHTVNTWATYADGLGINNA